MKKSILTLILALFACAAAFAAGDKAVISFKETSHDFGNIRAADGAVTAVYQFTNTGSTPLTIINVSNGGCGCTKPSFPKQPVAPGKSAEIKITFNPAGRSGEFNRTVKVKSNAEKARVNLTFSGVIIP